MKRLLKLLGISFLVVFTLIAPIQAAESDDSNLNVDYNVTVVSEKEANISINIKNIANKELTDVNIENVIPESFELIGNSESSIIIEKLNPGEEKATTLSVQLKDVHVEDNKDDVIESTGDDTNIECFLLGLGVSSVLLVYLLKNKKQKQFLSLLLVSALAISSLSTASASTQTKSIKLTEEIIMNEKEYTFSLNISYKINEDIIVEAGEITRGEWIQRLISSMDYSEIDFNLTENYFIDVDESLVDYINYAVAYKIIDTSENTFNPNDYATREFVAVTTVKALGYLPIAPIDCKDANEIQSPEEVETAVGIGLMTLANGYFYPDKFATLENANNALEIVENEKNTYDSIGDSEKNEIVYQEDVFVISEYELIETTDDKLVLTLNEQLSKLKENDLIVLENEAGFKIERVAIEEDTITLTTTDVSIEEVIKEVDIEEVVTFDFSNFIPAEGVTYSYAPVAASQMTRKGGSLEADGIIPKLEFTVNLSDDITIKGELEGKLKGLVKYDADFLRLDFRNITLKLIEDLELTVNIAEKDKVGQKLSFDGKTVDGFLDLGTIPLLGKFGTGIYVQLGLEYNAKGYFNLIVSSSGQFGLQVLNNRPKLIRELNTTVSPEVGAEIKAGPRIEGLLELLSFDLLDIGLSAGGKIEGKAIWRTTANMLCCDLGGYVYMEANAFKDCKLSEWLKIDTLTWDIWDENNSPVKLYGHFEKFKKVEECTYEDAIINGNVLDADSLEPIENAIIEFIDIEAPEDTTVKTVYSDSNGEFTAKVPGATTYRIVTSKSGYITFEDNYLIEKFDVKQLETRLSVKGTDGVIESGSAGGRITNSVTGEGVDGAVLKVRKNWNNTTSEVIKVTETDYNGNYEISDLNIGNYTLDIEKDGFELGVKNIVVTKRGNMNQNASINPLVIDGEEYELRVVLTWGENPTDVDSHLIGSSSHGEQFHVYYADIEFSENGEKVADLDVDDTDSFGPETVTLYKTNSDDLFSFYLHDYSNAGYGQSYALSNSGAQLAIYVKGKLIEKLFIPTNKEGTLWHAFDYDPKTRTIKKINQFSYEDDSDYVGSVVSLFSEIISEKVDSKSDYQ